MARMRVEGFDALMKALDNFADITEVSIKTVNATAPVLEKSLKNQIAGAVKKGYSVDHELERSIAARPAKKNQYGVFSVVGPVGSDSKGVSNAKKLAILEHGRRGGYKDSRGREVPPQEPCAGLRDKAVESVRSECNELIQKGIDSYLDKLWG